MSSEQNVWKKEDFPKINSKFITCGVYQDKLQIIYKNKLIRLKGGNFTSINQNNLLNHS